MLTGGIEVVAIDQGGGLWHGVERKLAKQCLWIVQLYYRPTDGGLPDGGVALCCGALRDSCRLCGQKNAYAGLCSIVLSISCLIVLLLLVCIKSAIIKSAIIKPVVVAW